ncbi:MAG: JAB domain-containing protein, partial [Anaerovoracaceae bacterium]
MGTLSSSLVSMREVFKSSVLSNAAAVICAHNHPSGSCQPSKEDELVTQRLQLCGELLDIKLVDHIIVAGESGRTCSLRALGLIDDRSVLSEFMNAKGQSVVREPDKRRLDERINSISDRCMQSPGKDVSREGR